MSMCSSVKKVLAAILLFSCAVCQLTCESRNAGTQFKMNHCYLIISALTLYSALSERGYIVQNCKVTKQSHDLYEDSKEDVSAEPQYGLRG